MFESRHRVHLYFVIAGGTTLYLECVKLPPAKDQEKGASPTLSVTGNMAKVMEESSKIGYTYSKTLLNEIDPDNEFFQKSSIHLHSPEVRIESQMPIIINLFHYVSFKKLASIFTSFRLVL